MLKNFHKISLNLRKSSNKNNFLSSISYFSTTKLNFIKNFPSNSIENSFFSSLHSQDKENKLKIHSSVELEKLTGALGYNLKSSDNQIQEGDLLLSVPSSLWKPYSASSCYTFIKKNHASWLSFLTNVVEELVPQESQAGKKKLIEICSLCIYMMNSWYTIESSFENKERVKNERDSYVDLLRMNSFPSNMQCLPHPLLMSSTFFIDPYLRSLKVYQELGKRQQLYERLSLRLFPSLEDSTYKPADDFLGSESLLLDSIRQNKGKGRQATYVKPPLPSFASILEMKSNYLSELEQLQQEEIKNKSENVDFQLNLNQNNLKKEIFPNITLKSLPLSSEILSKDFLWCLSQILSRGLSQSEENIPLTLVPFLDFTNHGDNSLLFNSLDENTDPSTLEPIVNAKHHYNAKKDSFDLIALRNIKPGESILISYGQERNSSSFLNIYGFYGYYYNLNDKLSITFVNEFTYDEEDNGEYQPALLLDASGEEIRSKVKKPLDSDEFNFNFLDDPNKIGLLKNLLDDMIDNKILTNIKKSDITIKKNSIQINLDIFSILLDNDVSENSEEYIQKLQTMKSFTYLCKLIHSIDYLHALEKYNRNNPAGFVQFDPEKSFSPYLEMDDYIRALFYIQKIIRFQYFTPEKFVSYEFQIKEDKSIPSEFMEVNEENEKKIEEEEKKKKFLNAKKYNKENIHLILSQIEKDEEIEKKFLSHLKNITDILLGDRNKKNPLEGYNPTHAYWIASCARFVELESRALVQLRSLIKYAINNS